jgi:pyruvate,water dikinase
MAQPFKYIRFFRDVCLEDIPLVGGKNASLGEMYRTLTPQGILVPNGFVVTAEAYRYVLESAAAWGPLHVALDGLDANNVQELARRGKQARDIVYGAGLPADLQREIRTAYQQLQAEYGPEMTVAVRSSATAEDLPTASFAGQHDTYLHITGDAVLLDACQRCFASLFTNRALHYRSVRGFDHFKVFLSSGS